MLSARILHRFAAISPALLLLALAPAVFASQVRVEVEGDVDNLQDNAKIFVGEVEGRTADGLRRYAPRRLPRSGKPPGLWAITIRTYTGRWKMPEMIQPSLYSPSYPVIQLPSVPAM